MHQGPTALVSVQDDVALAVEDEKFSGAKTSSYVLKLNKWKYNTDENKQSEHGFEIIFQGNTSTVFKVDAMVTGPNAGTNRLGESFVTKVGSAARGEEFE